MTYIDDAAGISAMRHARQSVVTASTDSVDFLHPIHQGNAVCLEAFVTYTGRTSMEIFVKVIAEDLLSGEKSLFNTAKERAEIRKKRRKDSASRAREYGFR